MVNFGPITAEIASGISTGFDRVFGSVTGTYCTALQYWVSAKLCGVEQRSPAIFGTAAITLGIGPHSSSFFLLSIFFSFLA